MSTTVSKISEYLKTVVGMVNSPIHITMLLAIALLCNALLILFGPKIFSAIVAMCLSLLVMRIIVSAKKATDNGEPFGFLDCWKDKEGFMYLLKKKEKVNVDGESAAEGQPEPTDSGK